MQLAVLFIQQMFRTTGGGSTTRVSCRGARGGVALRGIVTFNFLCGVTTDDASLLPCMLTSGTRYQGQVPGLFTY